MSGQYYTSIDESTVLKLTNCKRVDILGHDNCLTNLNIVNCQLLQLTTYLNRKSVVFSFYY